MALKFSDHQSFTVPLTSGNYAPERVRLAGGNPLVNAPALLGVTALIESNTATSAVLELWLQQPGQDPALDASYFNSGKSIVSGGETWPLASWPGAQLRAKSGGTAGAMVVDAIADE